MAARQFSASALIGAPAERLYSIIADYHHGHPRILPKPLFVGLEVEQGGVGAGTVIRVTARAMGRTQSYRAVITEPQPGRVLVETNDTGYVTSFTLDPQPDGRHTRVTVSTVMPERGAVLGALERWFMVRLLRPVYLRQLEMLAEVARAG